MQPNGSGARKCASWIEAFVASTDNLETPEVFRRWAAIAAIGAVLEQKVWVQTSSALYPNTYVFLIGHPGVGKTRTIRAVRNYLAEVPEFHLAPTSLTAASLVDALTDFKRVVIRKEGPLDYNTMMITADELGTFMAKYEPDMIGLLSSFFDVDIYGQQRRGKEIKIKIKRPQMTMLCGSTPANLMKFVPEEGWDQGFMSRVIMVFSDERIIKDIWANPTSGLDPDLIHDIRLMNNLYGQFTGTTEFRDITNAWREASCVPVPSHPKLIHYNTRRFTQVLKLSMISSVDKGPSLMLTKDDFNRAYEWLTTAEANMADVFKAGAPSADAKAMDEIAHYVRTVDKGGGVPEHMIMHFAKDRVPILSLSRIIGIMEAAHMIKPVAIDTRYGTKIWKANKPTGTD